MNKNYTMLSRSFSFYLQLSLKIMRSHKGRRQGNYREGHAKNSEKCHCDRRKHRQDCNYDEADQR